MCLIVLHLPAVVIPDVLPPVKNDAPDVLPPVKVDTLGYLPPVKDDKPFVNSPPDPNTNHLFMHKVGDIDSMTLRRSRRSKPSLKVREIKEQKKSIKDAKVKSNVKKKFKAVTFFYVLSYIYGITSCYF